MMLVEVAYMANLFLCIAIAAAFVYAIIVKRSVDVFPSFGWFAFVAVPLLVAWPYFPEPSRALNAWGVAITGVLLLVADWHALSLRPSAATSWSIRASKWAAVAAAGICIALMAYHLMSAETVPILVSLKQQLFPTNDQHSVFELRELFNRENMPFWLRYPTNFNIHLFGVFALVLAFYSKHRWVVVPLALVIIVYSVASTAQWPLITFLFGLALQVVFRALKKAPRILLFLSIIPVACIAAIAFSASDSTRNLFAANGPAVSALNLKLAQDDPRRAYSPSDFLRLPVEYRDPNAIRDAFETCGVSARQYTHDNAPQNVELYDCMKVTLQPVMSQRVETKLSNTMAASGDGATTDTESSANGPLAKVVALATSVYERLYYRAFLTPIDVSNRWYQYYTYAHPEHLPLSNMLYRGAAAGSLADEHPAVIVSSWAWGDRFDEQVYNVSHAPASIDADAFAYGGMWAVCIAAVIFALLRISFSYLRVDSVAGDTIFVIAISLMTLLPSSGSLPALLIPNGLAVLLIAAIMLKVVASSGSTEQESVGANGFQ